MVEGNQCPLLNCLNKLGMLWVYYKQFFVVAVVVDVVAVEDGVDGPNAVAVH